MKKIAFLFLTIDNVNFPIIWDKYLNGHDDKYTIYIHPKHPNNVIWHKDHIISNLQDTEWGFITRAYIELLKAALLDKDNVKFITLSESCIPIQSFDKFYSAVINDERSWIKLLDITPYQKSNVLKKTKGNFIYHYARWCINRHHVKKILVSNLDFFHDMHIGDEYFLSALHPLTNYRDFDVIFDDWEYTKEKYKETKHIIKLLYEEQEKNIKTINNTKLIDRLKKELAYENGHPKTITDVRDDLLKIKNCESFFYRKFAPNSNIEQYWDDIISYHSNKHKLTI
jgi:hypothetical protein